MPTIEPLEAAASWPLGEGTIGVVGVAPWATFDFCKALYRLVPAQKDWHYPRMLVDLNTKIPSRGRHLQLGERDPSPFIRATIDELAVQGATVCVVPCNTVHILFERWGRNTPIPVINIVDAVAERVKQLRCTTATIFGSASLLKSSLYQARLSAAGISSKKLPSEHQTVVDACIQDVKQSGSLRAEAVRRMESITREHDAGPDHALVIACTELSSLASEQSATNVVDSNLELARSALRCVMIQTE